MKRYIYTIRAGRPDSESCLYYHTEVANKRKDALAATMRWVGENFSDAKAVTVVWQGTEDFNGSPGGDND